MWIFGRKGASGFSACSTAEEVILKGLMQLALLLLLQVLPHDRRPSRQSSGGGSRISDDQIVDLVSKLQQLLPEIRNRRSNKVPASKVLQETCNYIRRLHNEVHDLSDRLSQLLASIDNDSPEAAIIRSLIT